MSGPESDTAERNFLLHAARVGVGTTSFLPELLADVSNWEQLFLLASQHTVTPLLCHALSPDIAGEIPVGAMTQRRAASRRLLLRDAQLATALLQVLDLFESNGICAIPYKGPSLAFQFYGQSGLRSSVDLDFLLRAEDMIRAKDVLLSRGYRTDCPSEPSRQAAYLRVRHELHFTREGCCAIELHQAFLPPFNRFIYTYDALWTRLRRIRFNDRDALFMAPEDLLLALCAHGTKHIWGRLAWICDIARLLVKFREELLWSRIDKLASSLGAQRMVLLGAFLAHELLDAPLPATILMRAQKDRMVARLATRVSDPWRLGTASTPGPIEAHLFFLQARERFRDRAAYCAHLVFRPTEQDHAAFSLPRFLSALYYPLHTLRVTTACALASLHRIQAGSPRP